MYGTNLIRCICNNQTPDGMFNIVCAQCGYYVHGICYQLKSGPITCVECQGQESENVSDKNVELRSLVKRFAFSLSQGEHRYFFGERPDKNVASIFVELRFNVKPAWARKVLDISVENRVLIVLQDGIFEYNANFDSSITGFAKEGQEIPSVLKTEAKELLNDVNCKSEIESVNVSPDHDLTVQAPLPFLDRTVSISEFDDQIDTKDIDSKFTNEPEIKLEATDENLEPEDDENDDNFDFLPTESKVRTKVKRKKRGPKTLGEQGPFKCEECDFFNASKTTVRRHRESVHLKIRYKCPHCDHESTKKAHLNQHILSIHEGKRYDCDQCGVSLAYPGALRKHIVQVHEGKKYHCDQCDKFYAQSTALKLHIKSKHEGVTYMCDQCPYTGQCKYKLAEHKKIKHEGLRYPCDLCPYQANSKNTLFRHKKRDHLGIRYHCEECTYTASTPGAVKLHKEVKHEGKVYPCNKCNYASPFKYKTSQHILTQHEGVRYNCDLCSYKTAHAGEVLKHKKKAHKELFTQQQ